MRQPISSLGSARSVQLGVPHAAATRLTKTHLRDARRLHRLAAHPEITGRAYQQSQQHAMIARQRASARTFALKQAARRNLEPYLETGEHRTITVPRPIWNRAGSIVRTRALYYLRCTQCGRHERWGTEGVRRMAAAACSLESANSSKRLLKRLHLGCAAATNAEETAIFEAAIAAFTATPVLSQTPSDCRRSP